MLAAFVSSVTDARVPRCLFSGAFVLCRARLAAMEPMCVIYSLHLPGGPARYVGRTTRGMRYRFTCHKSAARYGKKFPVSLWLLKHIEEAVWTVLEVCDEKSLAEREVFWIEKFRSEGANLLNLSSGGEGGARGVTRSPATRAKISASKMGVKRTPEMRAAQSLLCQQIGTSRGESNPRAVLSLSDVSEIRAVCADFESVSQRVRARVYRELAERFAVSYNSIYSVATGRTWKDVA